MFVNYLSRGGEEPPAFLIHFSCFFCDSLSTLLHELLTQATPKRPDEIQQSKTDREKNSAAIHPVGSFHKSTKTNCRFGNIFVNRYLEMFCSPLDLSEIRVSKPSYLRRQSLWPINSASLAVGRRGGLGESMRPGELGNDKLEKSPFQ